ncbi:TPA: hypothetical protein ACRSAD_001120 [Klebsiella quasipneumoniae]
MTSKLTRDRLQEIAEDGFLKHGESKVLARMALAAMDSEPVAWTWQHLKQWHVTNDEARARDLAWDGVKVEPLYRHAQPAPVVPDEINSASAPEVFEIAAEAERLGLRGTYASYAVGWNACRSAMLQELKKSAGTEAICRSNENVQAVEVQSLTSINPAPDLVSLQKKAESIIGNYPGIPDSYVMVPKEPTDAMLAAAKEWTGLTSTAEVVYIKMLAAATQEGK